MQFYGYLPRYQSLNLTRTSLIQFTLLQPRYFLTIWIFSSNLRLVLLNKSVPFRFFPKILYAFRFSPCVLRAVKYT
jgi:hypothetical protein